MNEIQYNRKCHNQSIGIIRGREKTHNLFYKLTNTQSDEITKNIFIWKCILLTFYFALVTFTTLSYFATIRIQMKT